MEAIMANDIIETAVAAGNFKTLSSALNEAGLTATLKGAGPYTMFAPTDAAFEKLPKGTVESLYKDKEKLKGIPLSHSLPANISPPAAARMRDVAKVNTITGK